MTPETVEKAWKLEQAALDMQDDVEEVEEKLNKALKSSIKMNVRQFDTLTLELMKDAISELIVERQGWKLKDLH